MTDLSIDSSTTALVLIDLQKGIVGGTTLPHAAPDVVSRAATLIAACRSAGVAVILVRVDPGPDGLLFPKVEADQPRMAFKLPPGFADLAPEVAPQEGDAVVTKHQPSAFYATDLEVHLARRKIRTIILCGISTNIGVEATARAANERGYEQIFVEDVMAAREADLHTHSVTRIFPTMGRVRSLEQVLAALK